MSYLQHHETEILAMHQFCFARLPAFLPADLDRERILSFGFERRHNGTQYRLETWIARQLQEVVTLKRSGDVLALASKSS